VATSERILTPAPPANIQGFASRSTFIPRARPAWRQPFIDLCLISLGLMVAPLPFGEPAGIPQAASIPPILLAMMVTTTLGFSGAYQGNRSPINIADTEGLVRGLVCTGVLLGLLYSACRAVPTIASLFTAGLLALLLVLQREIAYSINPSRKTPQRDASLRMVHLAFRDALGQEIEPRAEAWAVPNRPRDPSSLLKRTLDLVIATAILILVLPVCLIVALVIRIDSTGPALIRQRRIGRNGVPFEMWKFRSMHSGVARYARSPVSDTDPRLTSFGRRLRRLSLDELPQLLNVLKGDMSLVGPRPEMPFIVEKYSAYERLRLLATPGITGLWQISPARAMSIHENLDFDFFYIANRNIFLDLAILLRTLTAVVRGIGAT
jgi:lipopolysaccharide/colanic/teichoic acid biosynthesis glycosyltransferase